MFEIISKLKQLICGYNNPRTGTDSSDVSQMRRSLLDIAVEEYRMREVLLTMINKLNPIEAPRFESRCRYFSKEVEKAIENSGFRIVDVENFIGKPFDPGMAVMPLNIKDFDARDELLIQQIIEPVIMEGEKVARVGTVKLRRAN